MRSGLNGWEQWVAGAVVLLACVEAMRRWAQSVLASRHLIVNNGYPGPVIQALAFNDIAEMTVQQESLAA